MRCESTILVFLAISMAGLAAAQSPTPAPTSTLNRAMAPPPVLEIVTLEFPPLETAGRDGVPEGAAVDVVSEIFRNLSLPINIRVYPWTRSLQLVREGKADAIFTAYRNKQREKFLDYTNEILVNQVVSLYVKAGSKHQFKGDFSALRGKVIGVVSTISYGEVFDRAVLKYALKVDRVNEFQQNLKKLVSGRVDYVVSNRYTAAVELERLGLTGEIVELPVPVEVTPSYLAFSKARRHQKLLQRFDAALVKLKESGRYSEIMARHKVVLP